MRSLIIAFLLCLLQCAFAADDYRAQSGRITFTVGTNVPFLKVSGVSTAVTGSGEASVNGASATVRNLRFEVPPTSFKTGIATRDQHLYDRVFRAADGSLPRIALRADEFVARLDPHSETWSGELRAELSLRGVTRPVTFRISGQKKGDGAIVRAEGRVRTTEFDVQKISNSFATVNDEVTIRVSDLFLSSEHRP